MKNLLFISISIIILFNACKKESFITSPDAQVTFSDEELKFDTVFTTTGSITQSFKIINENDQKLRLSSIKLMGGNSSYFKINADGFIGPEVSNIEIEANDSVYVFVSVSINQNAANIPFIVRDSILVNYNGTSRQVNLEAWGQNAHFYRDKEITTNEIWNNDLPYVILGSLTIDPNKKLTINKGCRIYVHADAPIIVDGTLEVNGAKDTVDRVQFRGDRLDEPYNDFPGGWPGIYFRSTSKDNVFNYAVIKNAYQALAVLDLSINPKLTLNECIIDNAYDAGIIAVNSSIRARNCLISNCGQNVVLAKGGDYQFTHCTVATFSNSYILHRDPVLYVSNYVLVNNVPDVKALTAVFRNCIFWGQDGTVEDEVVVAKSGTATTFTVNFDYNLWKVVNTPANITSAVGIINNQYPEFDTINTSKRIYNFRLKDESPAKNKATNASITIDLDGMPRPVGVAPDLGSYERQ
jgi:hypothetical protein